MDRHKPTDVTPAWALDPFAVVTLSRFWDPARAPRTDGTFDRAVACRTSGEIQIVVPLVRVDPILVY